MRQNELMVGDWVKLDFYETPYGDEEEAVWKNGKITAIHHGNWVDVNFGEPLDECDIEVEDVRPIPLTPEILEKNGFRKGCYVGGYYSPDCPFRVFAKKEGKCGFTTLFDDEIHFSCVFVHQIQHALRLYGIEKEIEL